MKPAIAGAASMSSGLTPAEMQIVEGFLGTGSGYVLDFTNRSFDNFFMDRFGIDATSVKYTALGGSKAKRLRAIIAQATPAMQATIIRKLYTYYEERLAERGNNIRAVHERYAYIKIMDRLAADVETENDVDQPGERHMLIIADERGEPTHLGRLRRFARILTGSQRVGDALVKRILSGGVTDTIDLLSSVDIFVELVQVMVELWEAEPVFLFEATPGMSPLQQKALREVGKLDPMSRASFAATWIETFTRHELSSIFDTHQDAADGFADLIDIDGFAEPRKILLRGDVKIARTISDSISDFAYGLSMVSGEATVHRALSDEGADLLLIDSLEGWDGGVGGLNRPATEHPLTTIWVSDSTEMDKRVASVAQRGLISRPFDQSEIANTFRELLYIAPHRWWEPDSSFLWAAEEQVADEALAPTLAPIDAEIVGGRLSLMQSQAPDAAVSLNGLDAVREQHLDEAVWQADEFRKGNGAPRVQRHLDALVTLLKQQLTEQMVLRLTVGVDGMARQLSTIEAELMPLAASDIASLVTGLQQFINQFAISRQFRAEADAGRPITVDDEEALQSIAAVIIAQPATVVDPELRKQLELLEHARAHQAGSAVGDVARVSSLSNIVKAPARAIKAYGGDLLGEVRKLSIKALGTLIVGLASASGLQHLAIVFPEHFAAVYVLLTRAKKQLDEAGLSGVGEGED